MTDSGNAANDYGQYLGADLAAKVARDRHIQHQQSLGNQQAQFSRATQVGRVSHDPHIESDVLLINRQKGLYFGLTTTGPEAQIKVSNEAGSRYYLTLEDLAYLARINGVRPVAFRPEVVTTDSLEKYIGTGLDRKKAKEFAGMLENFYRWLAGPGAQEK